MKRVSDKVRWLLENYPELRDDDSKLVAMYYQKFCGVTNETPFFDVMYHHKDYGTPSFESIRRARQKIQEHTPYLRASKDVQEVRKEHEYKMYEFAKRIEI